MIGYIYKLHCPETNLIYIGSTTTSLHKRLNKHKTCKDNPTTSRTLFEISDNVQIELIEEFEFDDKKELERREGEIINENKDVCVNRQIAGRTIKEYRQDNKEHRNEKARERYAKNPEEYKAKRAMRNNVKYKCECGHVLRRGDKYRHVKSKKHLAFLANKNEN